MHERQDRQRPIDAISSSASDIRRIDGAGIDATSILDLQRAAGNRAVTALLQRVPDRWHHWRRTGVGKGDARPIGRVAIAERAHPVSGIPGPVQRAPSVASDLSKSADEGGPADVTNLEQDMRAILDAWSDGAKD